MKCWKLEKLGGLLAITLGIVHAQAQTPAALMFDGGVGAIAFTAGDVTAALEANGYFVTQAPLGDPSGATQPVRIILTTQAAAVPGMPTSRGDYQPGLRDPRCMLCCYRP